MLLSLVKNKEFLRKIVLANESLLVTDYKWKGVENLIHGLKPMYDATTSLQAEISLLVNFLVNGCMHGECNVKLRNRNTGITSASVEAMENRESTLLYHSAFLS